MKANEILKALDAAWAINNFSIFRGYLFTEPGDKIKGIPIEEFEDYMVLNSNFVTQAILDKMGQPETICDDLNDSATYYMWKIED